jgi:hypothetical protein
MHDAIVRMRDGREIVGPVWAFNPAGGYLTIPSQTVELLYFRDMVSAVQKGGRDTAESVGEDIDLLERARRWGWSETE